MKIRKDDILSEVFSNYPIIMEVYLKKGFHCVGCEVNGFETVGESLKNHNIEDITAFINYLNDVKDRGVLEGK